MLENVFTTTRDTYATLVDEIPWGELTIGGSTLNKAGSFLGIPDSNGRVPWLRCPSIQDQTIHPMIQQTVCDLADLLVEHGLETNIVKAQHYAVAENGANRTALGSHADKILDLDEHAPIAIFRAGATRIITMTHKETGETLDIPMPDGTLFVIPFEINLRWTHGISPDSDAGSSVSLVFRKSVTFKDPETDRTYGPRCQAETPDALWDQETLTRELIRCFRIENTTVVDLDLYRDVILHS